MATLPNALALTTIADGAAAVAADHRGNFTAIQTEANAMLAILDDGVAGQFLKGVGTTVSFDYPPGYTYNYNEFTSNASVTATTEATANTIGTAGALTFDGATAVDIEFFSAAWQHTLANGRLTLALYDGSSSIGQINANEASAGSAPMGAILVGRRLTPSAAAHTYSIRGFTNSGTATVSAGAGGAGNVVPGYIRITKA